ncbi:MAG: hypothetical protein Tp158DCM1229571_82 [Prokaryotic dsDNA virus sp.]|nr:MAG: hypothetical protein Tp158DCM1229571_82 [Prokaryotic dsDNA virus sp.]|tara:strand:+ start:20297 stop:20959 length:663 start_codon:yes stop_codon:yes gene_type:complete
MTQATHLNLDSMNTLDLYSHYAALSSSLSFLTPDTREIALAELETCSRLKSRKIDAIHYQITKYESMLEVGKQEKKKLDDAVKHCQSQINQMRSLLKELHRRGHAPENKIIGKDYEFTVSPIKDILEIETIVDDWSDAERMKYAMVKTTTTTTQCLDLEGNPITSSTKTKTETIPNVDALQSANENKEVLPEGVRFQSNYRITTKRLLNARLDKETSNNS